MHVPMPLLATAAIVFLLLAWLALRPRRRHDDLLRPPGGGAARAAHRRPASAGGPVAPSLPPDLETELEQLVRDGRKLQAIKRLRDSTGMALADAKDFVERM